MSPLRERVVLVLLAVCAVCGVISAIIGLWITAGSMALLVIAQVLNLRQHRRNAALR
jgi:hypothetical protein